MAEVVTSWDEAPRAAVGGVGPDFNTKLDPAEENAFKAWKQKFAPKDSGDDYDLRGAFKAGLTPDPKSGHWPDTFKKPNHPTFSDQSIYAPFGKPGSWQGDKYIPPSSSASNTSAPVVASWDDAAPSTVSSLIKRAANWVKEAAPGAVSDVARAAAHLVGLTSPAIAAKGGEQAAGMAEFATGAIPWAGNIAAGVTGIESSLAALMKGEPAVPAFYKGVAGAQELLKPVKEILAPQSPTGKAIATGFGRAVELGQELPLSPKSVAEAGYPGVAAAESGALQVLGIPALMKGAVSAVPLGGSLIAKSLAERARGVGSVSGAPALRIPSETQSVAAQLRAIRPAPPETPGGPTAAPPAGEGVAPGAPPIAPASPAHFNASPEWQPIPPDAVLPPGLEIRMNMQTGLNEARLKPLAPGPAPGEQPIKDQITGTRGGVTGGEEVDLATFFRKPVADVKDGALRLLARGNDVNARAAQAELDRRAAGRPAEPRAGVSPAPGMPPDEPVIPAPAGAPLFVPKPGDATDVPRHAAKGLEVVELPVAGLKLSTEVPQFKKAADVKGVVSPLGGKFDRTGVSPIQVWQRLNGDLEVISGRHRWDLAQRSGEETMPAQIHREADGFTARQAARLDAELNIRDEQGSIADYANYFRESGITEEAANAAGLLARAKGRTGFSIARDAIPEVYASHSAGLISDEAAASISRVAPGNALIQSVGLKLINEGRSITVAENTMRAIGMMEREGEAKPEQGDIFGFDDRAIKEAERMAKAASAAQRQINEQIAAVQGATKRPELARKLGVDVKDPEAVLAKIEELKAERMRLDNWPLYPDLVAQFRGPKTEARLTPPVAERQAPAPEAGDLGVPPEQEGEPPFVDTKTRGMFQERGPYELEGETEAQIREREAAAKTAETKAAAEAKKADEAARFERERKEIAERSKGAEFTLTPTEAVDRKAQAAADRQRAEADLAGQGSLFEPGAKYETDREPAPIWYSQLERSIDDLRMGAAPAQGWKDQIKGLVAKGVVKQAELDAAGLNEYLDLQEGKVTKQQVQEFLKQNGVKVEETVLGAKKPGAPTLPEYQHAAQVTADLNDMQQRLWSDIEEAIPPIQGVNRANLPWWGREMAGMQGANTPIEAEAKARAAGIKEPQIQMLREWGSAYNEFSEAQRRSTALYDEMKSGAGGVKFATYQLPGGENYKELLLRLPTKLSVPFEDFLRQYRERFPDSRADDQMVRDYWAKGVTVPEPGRVSAKMDPAIFKGPHFEEPNVLSHIRFNERTDATGARVLFLEELQSDWAQRGRKQGFGARRTVDRIGVEVELYGGATAGENAWRTVSPVPGFGDYLIGRGVTREQGERDILRQMNDMLKKGAPLGVPPAPYVGKTDAWVALSLKRMIRYAAENGFDKIAWTNGEQQAARYDLSKQVRAIEVRDAGDGDVRALAYQREGENDPVIDKVLPRDQLADLIGKDAAERALTKLDQDKAAKRPEGRAYLTGEDLKVGGEGMKGFYDNIMPKVANDVLKKLGGGRVTETRISLRGESDDAALAAHGLTVDQWEALTRQERESLRDTSPQPAFDITPAMREKAMAGQALFQPEGEYQPARKREQLEAKAADLKAKFDEANIKGRPERGRLYSSWQKTLRQIEELGGESQVREKIRGQAPEGQLDLFSEVPVKGSPVKTFEKIVVEAQKVGEHKVRATKVDSPGAAASVFQDLARSPMEKFQVLGLDADGTPIAFFDMFAGTVTQTSVFPREVWTAIYQTPGVKSVWVAHQHPSGFATPSAADMHLTRELRKALTPDIGIELKGHLIITKNKTIDIGPEGNIREDVPVAGGERTHTIPIMERVITKQEDAMGDSLSSPTAVRDFFKKLDANEPGLLFMDAQNRATAWWPMSLQAMSKLKTGDVNTGMAALLRQVGRGNAAAAIAWSPEPAGEAFTNAVRNVGTALKMADVRMIDAMTAETSGTMKSYAEHGVPMVNDVMEFNIGITPKAMAEGVGAMADLAKAAGRRAAETKLGAAAADWGAAVTEDLQTKIVPMAAGTDAARAIAKDFANADRLSRYQWTRFDEILKKEFTQEQRQKMWDAAEDENLVRMQKLPESERAGRGLDRLTKEERETMDTLQEYGDKLLERARDVGLFRGEGVEYWAPRMVAMIGEDGTFGRLVAKRTGPPAGPGRSPYTSPVGGNITVSAGSLKQRKYATVGETEAAAKTKFGEGAQVVRDIRTMPMAMARIERAIAGKELINAIKEFGKETGQEIVVDAAKDGYFTLDHPAFKIYRYRPDIKFTEAWDKNMWQAMHNFADSIGVKHERLLKMGGQTWGKAYMGGGRIETRFGGPETVMTHEIGHQLDYKYGLVEKFFGGDRPKSDFILERQIAKAEREGNTGLAEKYRKQITINREMRDLADLRFEGQEVSEYYKKYVRKGTEKMANMVHAYVHAPEKFRAVAPTAYNEFQQFLNQHPELSQIQTIKPSLTLGSGGFVKRPPGEDFDVFPVYVSREFEGPLKSIMSDIPGKLYSTMMDMKGKTMGVVMYSPLIHNGVEWGRALPLMPGKVLTFKAYYDGNIAKNDPQIMSQAIKDGLVPIGHRFYMQDITGLLEDPSLQPGRSWTAKLAGGAVGLVSKPAGEAVKRGIDAAGDFWHNTLLWDRVGDLQMGIYSNMKADLIKNGIDPETAGRMAAHFANRYAGALPNESMSAMARKVANFAFFSRTFTFGNLGVMKDMMTGLPRDVQAQIARDAGEVARFAAKGEAQKIAIKAFGTDIALMYAANSALQSGFDYMKRDKSLDEIEKGYVDRFDRMMKRAQESPSDLLKPFAMLESLTPLSENEPGKEYRVLYDYDETGTGIYVRLPTGKIGEEFLSWATSPLDILKRKEGTVARPLIQTLTNDRGFGRHVYNPDVPGFKGAARAMGDIAWNLLGQQFPTDSINAAIDIAKGHSDETDALKVIGPLFGLTFSKGAPGGPEVGEMFTMERQHRAEVSEAMPEIKKLIKHQDMETAVQRMYEAHMTPEEIRATIRFATTPRARLTPRAMRKFFQTAPPEERERMERMRERNQ